MEPSNGRGFSQLVFYRYGTGGVGEGEFDDNRAARGYDWYWNGPPSYVPNYASWVANQ